MKTHGIDIVCIQETRKPRSDCFVADDGCSVYLSGRGDDSHREYAGTGFIVAPYMKKFILGFNPISSRLSSFKLRIPGGCFFVFCVYAPHNGHPLTDRLAFYDALENALQKTSANGPRFVFGDFNARIASAGRTKKMFLGSTVLVGKPFIESMPPTVIYNSSSVWPMGMWLVTASYQGGTTRK